MKTVAMRLLFWWVGFTLSATASAGLINFDLTPGNAGDFGPGAAVFGGPTSVWNYYDRGIDPASTGPLSLLDDSGTATSVTVSYTRVFSGRLVVPISGAFGGLAEGIVQVADDGGMLRFAGLNPGARYDLSVFTARDAFSTASGDWSSLIEGAHYTLWSGLAADGGGGISVAGLTNEWEPSNCPACGSFTGFQLRTDDSSAIPTPTTLALLGLGLLGLRLRRK
ncbi:PEP-CTERM sorting domain-containing protein [Marinobacter salarius]|uniref:PEP-CTERM sorting domain-containing protein n=1 Tax=Marinobacter salarius TaxID=1420917 RepID=UPI0032EFD227